MPISDITLFFLAGLALLFLGIPISAVMAIIGVVGGLLAFGLPFMNSIGSVVWGVHNSFILTAVPLFILMGEVLLRSGVADKMYDSLAKWMGWMPGNLLHTNIGCCALFSATTGSSVACAATVGTVALPALEERGFSKKLSLGITGGRRHDGHTHSAEYRLDHLWKPDQQFHQPALCRGRHPRYSVDHRVYHVPDDSKHLSRKYRNHQGNMDANAFRRCRTLSRRSLSFLSLWAASISVLPHQPSRQPWESWLRCFLPGDRANSLSACCTAALLIPPSSPG